LTVHASEKRVHARIVTQPIDASTLLQAVADHSAGATALFLGTVRNVHDDRPVSGIDYQAYVLMAERELRAIVAEAAQRFGTWAIGVEHRVGYLGLGETSVAIAASHARRAPAFDAARYVIEEIKRRVPIWKREHYADGTREWVDPTRAGSSRSGVSRGASEPISSLASGVGE
jgi:molybdopterin synthase catalytic subunit